MINFYKKLKNRLTTTQVIQISFFLSAIIAWPIMADADLFERFYDYSRAHEDWNIDEFALLIVNLSIALILSALAQSIRLKQLIRQRDFQRDRAEENARHDPLTGLMNRRAFAAALEDTAPGAQADDHRYLAMMDLDRFKPVNDLHGHAAGDAIIQEVADRLTKEITELGRVGRLGGDEFAIIFETDTDAQGAERAARRLIKAIEQPFRFGAAQIHIGCSLGLTKWTSGMSSAEALRRADKSLYVAKSHGRGRFAWYDPELDRRSQERAEIEADMKDAIARDEIEAWFQPIVSIERETLLGFEVLARWTHPKRGAIPPSVFIAIAEDCGQISALGLSILRQACATARDWDPKLTLSINLSPLQFHDPRLVEQIAAILADCQFDAKRLTIEITESAIIRDMDVARTKLKALKALGVAVSLDDFGTGYSSLASLRQLPFDSIKIDRSFVSNISSEPMNQKIVTGIMALASGLELSVTAEGIESSEDLDYLQKLQCPLGQGFLFEKAVPGAHVPWIIESSWDRWPEIFAKSKLATIRPAAKAS